eukprot:gb/GECG01010855.1/.p1 GENE.gb/GECG01010855.1/~~gb/GECG01010855.1/.p1  ORF type:complete len:196 (+),score=11.58 gb/GECG01010855.1/:1-588(+)
MMTPANRAARQAGGQQTPLDKFWDFASNKSNAKAILTTVVLVFLFVVTYMVGYDRIAQHLPTMIMKNVKTEPAFPDTQIVSLMKERKWFLEGHDYLYRSGLFPSFEFYPFQIWYGPKNTGKSTEAQLLAQNVSAIDGPVLYLSYKDRELIDRFLNCFREYVEVGNVFSTGMVGYVQSALRSSANGRWFTPSARYH